MPWRAKSLLQGGYGLWTPAWDFSPYSRPRGVGRRDTTGGVVSSGQPRGARAQARCRVTTAAPAALVRGRMAIDEKRIGVERVALEME